MASDPEIVPVAIDDDDDDIPVLVPLAEGSNETNSISKPQVRVDETLESQHVLPPCPVTILSGFLGSGKTTLIQYILKSPDHGKRIAIIENEFGEGLNVESLIAKDGVKNADGNNTATIRDSTNTSLADLIELPNGCVCCTVKDTLVATLDNLLTKKRTDLDYIIIECSGMANPGPIATLFWLDQDDETDVSIQLSSASSSRLRLDGIVTLIDCKNILQQLQECPSEAAQQIAYADRLILNKTDLLSSSKHSIDDVINTIRAIHPTAPIRQTKYSAIPDLDWILDTHSFDPYGPKVVDLTDAHNELYTQDNSAVHHHDHNHNHGDASSCTACQAASTTSHQHTSAVSTLSLVHTGSSVRLQKLHRWLAEILWPNQDEQDKVLTERLHRLLSDRGPSTDATTKQQQQQSQQIFRIKGIVSVRHESTNDEHYQESYLSDNATLLDARRFIVQAVHDLWDIHPASDDLAWDTITATDPTLGACETDLKKEERTCKLVVIGRFLEEESLRAGFRSCMW